MLINVKDASRMPLKHLWQLIFTFTFDKKSCGHMTKDVIGRQLMKWHDFIEINKKRELEAYGLDPEMSLVPIGKKGSVLDEMEYQLQLMSSWVVREEAGEFIPKVELYKKNNIDFRLSQPACMVFEEYARARRNPAKGAEALKVNMADKPEQYADTNKKRQYFIGRDV
jgi:inner membrane protein involved in colicin E2 resistance